MEFHRCIDCYSKDDVDCLRNASTKESVICKSFMSNCLTGIDVHGHTRRRCSEPFAYEHDEFPRVEFDVCSSSNCNIGIFPTKRLKCYHSDAVDERNLIASNHNSVNDSIKSLEPVACSIFDNNDQCYVHFENGKIFANNLFET